MAPDSRLCPADDPTDDAGWQRPPVTATLDEILYAESLRLQIREQYDRRKTASWTPWSVGVD